MFDLNSYVPNNEVLADILTTMLSDDGLIPLDSTARKISEMIADELHISIHQAIQILLHNCLHKASKQWLSDYMDYINNG